MYLYIMLNVFFLLQRKFIYDHIDILIDNKIKIYDHFSGLVIMNKKSCHGLIQPNYIEYFITAYN